MSDFKSGAKAMFDYLLDAAANTDDQLKIDILREYAEDAFDYVSEDACSEWRDISYISAENIQLKKDKVRLFADSQDARRIANELQAENEQLKTRLSQLEEEKS